MKLLLSIITVIFILISLYINTVESNILSETENSGNEIINRFLRHSGIPPPSPLPLLPPPPPQPPLDGLVRKTDNVQEIDEKEGLEYRLPKNIVPKYYAIRVTPHMIPDNFTFDGFVEITTQVVQNSTEIVLNVDNITIESVNLEFYGNDLRIANVSYDEKHQFMRITAANTITTGSELIIKIKYLGYMNAEKQGLYRNFYIDKFNQTKWFAVTHLRPIGARRVFPCFDEPALRANFQLKISRTADFKAMSITKLNSTIKENDRYLDIFEETPVISTYSVALVLSEFSSVNETRNYFDWTPNASREGVESEITRNFDKFQFYEDLWKHKNELENWNLITYDNNMIITNPNYVSAAMRQAFANRMIYETAFGYNGYEMSPYWWENVWFNFGFSLYYISTTGKTTLNSHYDGDGQFIAEQLQTSLLTDASSSSRPLSHDVYSPDQIKSMLDHNSNIKGASIVRMMKYIAGTDTFWYILNSHYFDKRWQSTEPNDIYPILQDKFYIDTSIRLNTSVKTLMNSWVTQAGYPVVHVKINKSIATLSQKRFLLNNPDKISINQIWWIPITWKSSLNANFSDTKLKYMFGKAVDSITVDEVDDNGWIIFNIRQAGYYRVNYDDKSWSRLIKALKSRSFTKIDRVNRGVLLDDLLNLARAGYVDYATALSATEYLIQETEYIPWKAALNNFVFLDKQIVDKNIHDLFKNYVLKTIEPIYKKVGFEEKTGEGNFDLLLRANIIDWACKYGNHHCIENSLRLFYDWKFNPSKLVNVNLRGTVFCTAVKYGPDDNWEYLWNKYLETNYQTEKATIINALVCTKNDEKLRQLLLKAIDRKSGLRYEDSLTVFSAVFSSGRLGANQTLHVISERYNDIYNYYNKDYNKIKTILKGLSNHLATQELIWQLEDFVNKYNEKLALINNAVVSFIRQAKEDVKWYDKYSKSISNFLSSAVGDHRTPEYSAAGTIYPIKYNIQLIPDIKNYILHGALEVKLYVTKTISKIILDANKLNISDIKIVYTDTSKSINSLNQSYDAKRKFIVNLSSSVEVGSRLTMSIKYVGQINNETEPFYQSSYEHNVGKNLWIASKWRKSAVSRIFPTFDESENTTSFRISVRRPKSYQILSSIKFMNFTPSETFNGTWDNYEAIDLMPPHNIVFILTDFKIVDNYYGINTPEDKTVVNIISEDESIVNFTSQDDFVTNLPGISTTPFYDYANDLNHDEVKGNLIFIITILIVIIAFVTFIIALSYYCLRCNGVLNTTEA